MCVEISISFIDINHRFGRFRIHKVSDWNVNWQIHGQESTRKLGSFDKNEVD